MASDFERFRALVDEVSASQTQVGYGDEPTLRIQVDAARAPLQDANGQLAWHDLASYQEQLIYDFVLAGSPMQPYYGVLSIIMSGGRVGFGSFDRVAEWRALVSECLRYFRATPVANNLPPDQVRRLHGRPFQTAEAIQRLRGFGYALDPINGTISGEQLVSICRALIAEAATNPEHFGDEVWRRLSLVYDSQTDHYTLGRLLTTSEVQPRGVPFGLLRQVALKIVRSCDATSIASPNFDAKNLVERFTDLATVCDTSPANIWELVSTDPRGFLDYVEGILRHDLLFRPKECDPEAVIAMVENMFGWAIGTSAERALGDNVADIVAVVNAIVQITGTRRGLIVLGSKEVSSVARVDGQSTNRILKVLSWPIAAVNRDFDSPFDYTTMDSLYKPLLDCGESRFLLPDLLLAGEAFYEAIADGLRSAAIDEPVDSNIGVAFESYIRSLLEVHALRILSGKYKVNEGEFECDAVVDCPDEVVFVECKKKGMTRLAMSGDRLTLMTDMVGSVLSSHRQLMRHAYFITREGYLEIGGQKIELNGRRIGRVALTLLDLGGLADLPTVLNLVAMLGAGELRLPPEASAESVERTQYINKVAQSMAGLITGLIGLDVRWKKWWKGRSATLSLGSFLFILRDVRGCTSFLEALWKMDHLVTGIGDVKLERSVAAPTAPPGEVG